MQSALSTLSVLPSTKAEGEQFKEMLLKEISAEYTPLATLVQLKVLEKMIKELLTNDALDEIYLLEFNQFAKNNKLDVNGATLTSQEFGSKYLYSTDNLWMDLDSEIKRLTEMKKKREDVLKSDEIKVPGKLKIVVKL
jgi:hypothetical protein